MRIERRGLVPSLLLAASSIAFAPAHAQSVTPALKACMTEPDGPTRLACYDREMRRIEGAAAPVATAAPPASSAAPVASAAAPVASAAAPVASAAAVAAPVASAPARAAPTAASPQEQFGLPPDADREARMPKRITAKVALATRQASGRYTITLENGEVWLQTEDQLGFTLHQGSSVSIKRGLLGSYWLTDKYYVVAVRRLR
jgi:hypothetical protein